MVNQAQSLPFKSIGHDVTIWPLAKIVLSELISIGNSVIIDDFVFFVGSENTEIGSFVHIGSHTSIVGGGTLIMEDFAGLSGGVRVYTGNEDYLGGSLTNPTVPPPYRIATRDTITIKKHAIVGANSVLLPGITIGEGVAIGANSVVSKNLEDWTIYAGSPARAIRARPKEKMIELEQQLRANLFDEWGRYIPKGKR